MIVSVERTASGETPTSEANADWDDADGFNDDADPIGLKHIRSETLELALRRHIIQRTWGGLRQLQVEVYSDHVVVRGRSPTYYLKQLALAAVQEAILATPVEFDIHVVMGESRLVAGVDPRAGLLP